MAANRRSGAPGRNVSVGPDGEAPELHTPALRNFFISLQMKNFDPSFGASGNTS